VITIHQRYRQTDRQTDRQTTCDGNTALCTKVHRAVKTKVAPFYLGHGVVYTRYSIIARKMVGVRIMQFSPYTIAPSLGSAG